MTGRPPLSTDRVLRTARDLADREGITAVTMRRLAEELGVEAMSLYHHTPNKQAILSGIADLVLEEAATEAGPATGLDSPAEWKSALRSRILGSRRVMLRHPWAPAVIEAQPAATMAMARHVDAVVGVMRAGGFTYDQIHHALHALGSRQYGFTQEIGDASGDDANEALLEQLAAVTPNLAAMLTEVAHDDPDSTLGWCDDQTEFEFGLDLLLDGLDRLRGP